MFTKQSRFRTKKVLTLFVILLCVIVLGLLEITGTTHIISNGSKTPNKTASSISKGVKNGFDRAASGTEVGNAGTQPDQSTSVKQNSINTSDTLISPTGTFANIYKGVSLSDLMQSTCNTSPGATCQIIFTRGSVTKSLPMQAADAGGAVYWSWRPGDSNVGLSPGTWHIMAKSSLGSQIKTTDNGSLELEIVK